MTRSGEGTYVYMPHALGNIIGTWTRTGLSGVASSQIVPLLGFEVPDGAREKARGDEVEEAGGDDEEDLHFR